MNIIAVDPGLSGGIAWVDQKTHQLTTAPMPDTLTDIAELLKHQFAELQRSTSDKWPEVYMEQLTGYAGGPGNPGSAMFKLGINYGALQMICIDHQVPLKFITPAVWQKRLSLGVRGAMTKGEWKNKLKATAQRLYPHMKITLKTADAVLIHHVASHLL